MQFGRLDALCRFHRCACPIGGKVTPAYEDNGKEKGNGPDNDNSKHGPENAVEHRGCPFGEDSPVEEDEARFD